MVELTDEEKEEQELLKHILTLCRDKDNKAYNILNHNHIGPVDVVTSYSEDALAALYKGQAKIPVNTVKLLVMFKKFHIYRQATGQPHAVTDWKTLYTREAFDKCQ